MSPMVWAALMLVASIAISSLLAPRQARPKPSTMDDMNIPQVEEGTPQSVFFGTVWTGSWTVLWFGNFRTSAVKAKQGKK